MKRKTLRILCLCVLLLALAGGGVYAWLTSGNHTVTGTITPAAVSTAVQEDGSGENVCVQNTGGVTAYIRAAVVVNLLDAQGNVSAKTPEPGTDYTIAYASDGWTQGGDGYYYYAYPVAPGERTAALIETCTARSSDSGVQVQVLAEGVQSVPAEAVGHAWGAAVDAAGALTPGA